MTNHAVYPKLIILYYWNAPSGWFFALVWYSVGGNRTDEMQHPGGVLLARAGPSQTMIKSIPAGSTRKSTNFVGALGAE